MRVSNTNRTPLVFNIAVAQYQLRQISKAIYGKKPFARRGYPTNVRQRRTVQQVYNEDQRIKIGIIIDEKQNKIDDIDDKLEDKFLVASSKKRIRLQKKMDRIKKEVEILKRKVDIVGEE